MIEHIWCEFDAVAELAQDPAEGNFTLNLHHVFLQLGVEIRLKNFNEIRVFSEDVLQDLECLRRYIRDMVAQKAAQLYDDVA